MKTILTLQQYTTPLTVEAHDVGAARLKPCLEEYGVTWKRSFLSQDCLQMWCQFEASDAEAVRRACRSADIPLAGAWQVNVHESA